ncbi:MAG: ubiquinone biosynthesis protein UbiJ [Janthinobacterium sp.]|jgi:ubiquinone biosynthesis protein UbiJ
MVPAVAPARWQRRSRCVPFVVHTLATHLSTHCDFPMPPVIAVINHLLAQEPWASRLLARHAGKIACIDAGALVLHLCVGGDGLVQTADPGLANSVTIRFKLADLPLIAQNPERAFSYVNIDGDAEFANAISQLSKTVRWDAEHDLEKVVGQIAAKRITAGVRQGCAAALLGQQRLAENVAEYFLEEQPMLVRLADVEAHGGDVTRLRDDVERVVKRIEKIEKALARKTLPPSAMDRT